jgi:hypothetical protein
MEKLHLSNNELTLHHVFSVHLTVTILNNFAEQRRMGVLA